MKWATIVLFFLVFYSTLGLWNFIQTNAPNGTNDFIFHYFHAREEFTPEVQQYYTELSFQNYPSLLANLTGIFAVNKLTYYLFGVLLIIVAIPFALFKLAGDKAVFVYFLGVSMPHMALYSAVYASMVVMLLFLIYLKYRKWWVWVLCAFIASFTHNEGLILFIIVGCVEIFVFFFKDLADTSVKGLLIGANIRQPFEIFDVFLCHTNFILIWLARKSFDTFYAILFLISVIGTYIDLRVINIAQLILCIVLAKTKFDKKIWILLIIIGSWNTFNFAYGTARFLY